MLTNTLLESNYIWVTIGYIDPGTGSLMIQIAIGFIVAVGASIKIFWHKIKGKLNDKQE